MYQYPNEKVEHSLFRRIWRHTVDYALRVAQKTFVYAPIITDRKYGIKSPPLFNAVFFEVRTRCNGTCSFCAASVSSESRADKSMPFEIYKKVIDELSQFHFSGRIAYHVNNDPLIFRPLPEFISYARQMLPSAWIQVLTNGKALTPTLGNSIIAAGLNELSINVYNDDLAAPLPAAIEDVRNLVLPKFFRPHLIQDGFGPDPVQPGIFRFNIFRRLLNQELETRGGSSPNKIAKAPGPRGFCEYPFTQLNVNVDGTVSKCCSDFYFGCPMGNVLQQSVLDIWYGEKFKDVRTHLLAGKRGKLAQCKDCDFYGCFGGDRYLRSSLARAIYDLTK